MTANDRRRNLYQRISQAKQVDPLIFTRRAAEPDQIARHAFRTGLTASDAGAVDRLREAAHTLGKSRK